MNQQPLFVQAFFQHWLTYRPKLTPMEKDIFMYLTHQMDITNVVRFTKKRKEQFAKDIDSTFNSVNVAFYKLLKTHPDLIQKIDENEYMICPDLAAKINRKDFDKLVLLYEFIKGRDREVLAKMHLYKGTALIDTIDLPDPDAPGSFFD